METTFYTASWIKEIWGVVVISMLNNEMSLQDKSE